MEKKIIPELKRRESGRIDSLERFPNYVARQIGLSDANKCPHLCKLAKDYLKKTDRCERNIYEYFATDPEAELLYVHLIEELERCILTYFAFHWSQTSLMISQVMGNDDVEKRTKLKDLVMAATRLVDQSVNKYTRVEFTVRYFNVGD